MPCVEGMRGEEEEVVGVEGGIVGGEIGVVGDGTGLGLYKEPWKSGFGDKETKAGG